MDDKKKERVFMRGFYTKVGKAIFDYNLIENGDKILVGVSGGKDSLALLEVLALRSRDKKYNYEVIAAHVSVENVQYEVDEPYIREMCERLGIPFYNRSVAFEVSDDCKKPHCFVCSWNRRKALFSLAKELGCSKMALGHHKDDAIESLLMSMMFNGTIASMPPKLSMFDGTFTLIRPLIYLTNDETLQYASYRNFKKQIKNCPYEKVTNRGAVGELIKEMEKLSPHVRGNLFASMKNVQEEYLL